MNNIFGFAFLALFSRTLSDNCGVKFGFDAGLQLIFIYEDGTFIQQDGEQMILELPLEVYIGKIQCNKQQ